MIDKKLLTGLMPHLGKDQNYDDLADNLDLLEKAQAQLHGILITARMKKLMRNFGERDTDVYVVSFPRSGTTLMQMILYQLTTDGDMSFNHLYDVSPWCRYSAFFNREMSSVGSRRIIKSHDEYSMLENIQRGKFIFLLREGLDVISSVYQQALDYVDPAADFNTLSARNMERWLQYNHDWISNPAGLEMLYVHYEDLVTNKAASVRAIADFLNLDLDEPTLRRVIERTSLAFMKAHETKFGEQPDHWKVYHNFIRNGKIGAGAKQFTEEQKKQLNSLAKQYQLDNTPLSRYFS